MDELSLERIGSVVRNSDEEIVIQTGTYWNVEVVDIRWFKKDTPTGKGIRMNIDEANKVLNLLRRKLNENKEDEGCTN